MIVEGQLQLDVPQLVLEAHERCQDYLSPTPLEYSPHLIEGESKHPYVLCSSNIAW